MTYNGNKFRLFAFFRFFNKKPDDTEPITTTETCYVNESPFNIYEKFSSHSERLSAYSRRRSKLPFRPDNHCFIYRSGGLLDNKLKQFLNGDEHNAHIVSPREWIRELSILYYAYTELEKAHVQYRRMLYLRVEEFNKLSRNLELLLCDSPNPEPEENRWEQFCDNTTTIDEKLFMYENEYHLEWVDQMTNYFLEHNISFVRRHNIPKCCICFDGLNPKHTKTLTCCKQQIHGCCLFLWHRENSTCPLCRSK